MSNPNPPTASPCAPRWFIWTGLLALLLYGVFIERHYSIVAGGSDSSGYLNSARLFAEGKFQTELRAPAEFGPRENLNRMQFLPLGFWPFPNDPKITPTYPTGLPLHFALASKVFGWTTGPRVVGLFIALGAVCLCYLAARELGLDWRLAAAAAVTLAVCPQFLFSAFQPLSDAGAATWCLAAFWAALRSRCARGWAVACGTAFAVAVLLRPTNLVFGPTLLILLGFDWRRLALTALGGLPGVAWLAIYNRALYGGALRSGYGDWFSTFAWSWGPPTAWHFLKWLALLLPAVLLVLPLAAVASREFRTRGLLALAVWFAAIVGLYTFYEVSHEVWWCLRFILPAIPALILAGGLGLEALAHRTAPARRELFYTRAALIVALWAVGLWFHWNRQFAITEISNGEKTFAKACAAAQEKFPPGTLIATMTFSGAFYYYTDFPILRWDQVEPAEFARMAAAAQKAGRAIVAVDFRWEEPRALREHCAGNWEKVGQVGDAVLWKLGPIAPTTSGQ